MNLDKKKVLVLAPHTDDGEFGCGGTIVKLIEARSEVHYVAFSSCRASVPAGFPDDVLIHEVKAATKILGIPPTRLYILDYPVRQFAHHRQDILEDLVKYQRLLNPDLVFLPSVNDLHQDHHTVAMEGIRAFKQTTILAYEMPWNNIIFSTQAYVKLEQRHMNIKLEALKEYKSQAARPYASRELVCGLAKARGVSAGADYAEAFEVVRLTL
ncbi:MAG: PIG-L family deacetylase [Deltaproteobacteria bacterium]|nr:PIG-L family deacetylase [Deltaproteobacteria bacterium]